jgi:hypothetical protein
MLLTAIQCFFGRPVSAKIRFMNQLIESIAIEPGGKTQNRQLRLETSEGEHLYGLSFVDLVAGSRIELPTLGL